MIRIVLLAALVAAAAAPGARAEEGTPAQRLACTADVIRLCHPGIADARDHARVIACVKANKNRLSPACKAALSYR